MIYTYMNLGYCLFLALAIYRISALLTYEEGPYRIFSSIRNIAREKHLFYYEDEKSKKIKFNFYKGITCLYCNSMWFSLLFNLFFFQSVLQYVLCVFITGTFVMIIDGVMNRLEG